MTASVISAEAISWGTNANPTGQSITVPGDCTKVAVFSGYYLGGSGGILTVTLDSNAPDFIDEHDDTFSTRGAFVAVWDSPSTGVQTLDVEWDAAHVLPPTCIVVYIKDAEPHWRDVDYDADTGSNPVTVTLTTVSDDLVIKYDANDSGGFPPLSSGWTNIATHVDPNEVARASYIIATGSTQVCDAENESGSVIIAVSIESSGVGGSTGTVGKLILIGVG